MFVSNGWVRRLRLRRLQPLSSALSTFSGRAKHHIFPLTRPFCALARHFKLGQLCLFHQLNLFSSIRDVFEGPSQFLLLWSHKVGQGYQKAPPRCFINSLTLPSHPMLSLLLTSLHHLIGFIGVGTLGTPICISGEDCY